MYIKAEYKNLYGSICRKFFHNIDEMHEFFEKYKGCKYISHIEGDEVFKEASERGFK